VPNKYALVQTPTDFVAESTTRQPVGGLSVGAVGPTSTELEGWIGANPVGLLDFPAEGNAFVYSRLGPADSITVTCANMSVYTVVISLAVAIAAWFLRRNRWETLATLVIAVGLLVALGALLDAELVWNLLLAARYGFVAVVAIWLIQAFHRYSARRPTAAPPLSSTQNPPGVVIPPPGIFQTLLPKKD